MYIHLGRDAKTPEYGWIVQARSQDFLGLVSCLLMVVVVVVVVVCVCVCVWGGGGSSRGHAAPGNL